MDSFMETIYQIFNNPFFVIVGGIFTVFAVTAILISFIAWVLGVAPLLWRLGYGRWYRKIAIVAKDEYFNSLKNDLVDSGIFREKNIFQISSKFLSKIKDHYLLVVHYQSFTENEIKEIIVNKNSKAGMVFYYPEFSPKDGKVIPDAIVKIINSKENTTIVNFRGRLLNDIIITLITTSYEKR